MIEKPKRPVKLDVQERQPPRTLQELVNRYDLDNIKIYDYLDDLVPKINEKIKVADFTAYITPTTERGSSGYGEATLDISELKANKILSLGFHASSTFILCGTSTDLSLNPSSVLIFAYRISGTYTGEIAVKVRILYE